MIKETKPARYIVFQNGVIQFAMNFKKKKSKFLLFKEESLPVCYEPTLSLVSGRGYFPCANLYDSLARWVLSSPFYG